MAQIPIDQAMTQARQQAIHIAQQILPIVLQQHMSLSVQEQLTRDRALDEHAGKLPDPAEIVKYSLDIGLEFIAQANEMLNAQVPGLTGTT